jgi:hypothetical protein
MSICTCNGVCGSGCVASMWPNINQPCHHVNSSAESNHVLSMPVYCVANACNVYHSILDLMDENNNVTM